MGWFDLFGGDIINGVFGFGAALTGGLMDKKEAERQRDWQEEMWYTAANENRYLQAQQQNFNQELLYRQYQMNTNLQHDAQNFQQQYYNANLTPFAMRRQYELAGFNPYLAMGNTSAGIGASASSVGSSSSGLGSAPSVPQGAKSNIGAILGQAKLNLMNKAQFDLIESQAKLNESQANRNDKLTPAEEQKFMMDAFSAWANGTRSIEETREAIELFGLRKQNLEYSNENIKTNTDNTRLQMDATRLQIEMMRLKMPFVQAECVSNIMVKISEANLNDAKAVEATANAVYTQLKQNEVKFTPEQWTEFRNAVIEQKKSDARISQSQANMSELDEEVKRKSHNKRVQSERYDYYYGDGYVAREIKPLVLFLDELQGKLFGRSMSQFAND